jgi:hypothetical protein
MAALEKKVRFSSTHFYQILDNLFVSDQIATFDEELLQSHQIDWLINLTPSTPFLSIKTNNLHVPLTMNMNMLELDELVEKLFLLLRNKKKVLLFCENGVDKSLVFLTWKTKQTFNEKNKFFRITRMYRDMIINKNVPNKTNNANKPNKQTKIIQHIRKHFLSS